MPSSFRRTARCVSTLWLSWLAHLPIARASEAADAPNGSNVVKQAEAARLYEEALEAYDRNELDAAITKLKGARQLASHPDAVYNLALFLEAASRWAEARQTFEDYLVMVGEAVSPERATAIRAKLDELASRLARVRIDPEPETAEVRIDGEAARARVWAWVEPGKHRIEIRADRFQRVDREIELMPGVAQQLVVPLRAEVTFTPGLATSVPLPKASPKPASVAPSAWALSLGGAGALLLAAAATTHLVRQSQNQEWQGEERKLDAVPAASRDDAYWSARADNSALSRKIRYLDGVTVGLVIGGGLSLAAGVGWWITSVPSAKGTSVSYAGRW